MNQLVLPIALWGTPPPHSVTSILIIMNRSVLVTGSNSGQICVWSFESDKPSKEGGLTPLLLCLGHNSPINALVECNFEGTDAFISISSDGVMHAWRAQDGKCLKGGQFTAFYPLQFACIPGDKRRIALAGCHCDIELIDAWSLKPMSTLRGHQDWVTALTTCVCDNKEPILLSASRDGLVHFWTMKFGEHYPIRTVCIDEGPVPDISPLSLVLSPDLKSFVVVTPREWLLYTTQNSHFICVVACPEGAEWLSAKYLDNETLLAWTSQAIAAAYQLTIPSTAETLSMAPSISTILANEVFDGGSPPNTTTQHPLKLSSNFGNTNIEENITDTGSTTNINMNTITNTNKNTNTKESIFATISPASPHYQGSPKVSFPLLLYTINEFPPDNYSSPSSISSSSSSSFASSSIALSHSSSFSSILNVRSSPPTYLPPLSPKTSPELKLSLSSSISPSFSSFFDPNMHRYESSFSQFAVCSNNFFALGDANGQVGLWNVKRDNVTHWCSGKISDGWKGINTPTGKAVTATLVLEDSFVLIRGHENGQLSCSTLPTDAFPKFYKAHLARVNCLLCSPVMPNSFSSKSNSFSSIAKRLLITGSDDFTIKVWELPTFELIHTFTHHTGPITWLFLPPYNPRHPASNYWGISEDKCVGQYSLDGMKCLHLFGVHPALVSSVKCKWEQDYLVVESVDGGVALWEIATGELEGIVYGQMAREISENSDTFYNHPRGSPKVTLSQTESHFSNFGSFANFTNFSYPSSPKKDGSFSPSVSGKKDGNFGVSVRAAYIPTLLHRSPIQLLYLDVKHIAREIRSYLPNQESTIFTPSDRPTSLNLNASPKSPNLNINSNYSNSNPNSNLNSSHDSSKRPHLAHSFEGVNPRRQSLQVPAPATVASLVNLPSYQVFSYLIPWGIDKQWDSIWKKDLNLRPPVPNFTFASEAGKWRLSTELTSTITLSAVTLAKVLLNLSDSKNSCGQILSYYCGLFPEMMTSLPLSLSFSDPLLPMLAIHTLDTMEEVVSASHSILFSALDKFTNEARREITHNLSEQLKATHEAAARGLMAIVLATIGAYRPDAIDDIDARTIAIELLKILYKPNTGAFTQGAVELLGKGYATWRQHIKDPSRLIRALFALSQQTDSLGQVSHLSLLLVGAQDPKTFIICLAQEIHRDYSHPHSHSIPNHSSAAVMVLGALVRKDCLSVLSQLPRLVETIVKSLDPHSPSLRDACLKASTAVLHVMVTKYPMVSFHQETQRMAVGTGDNAIVIYDLKTATRWHVLEGHKNTISAVAFSENGKALASYSFVECAVRIWQASSSFLGILGGAQLQCVKVFAVSKAPKPIPLQMQLQSVKVQWLSPSIVTLYRGWDDPVTFNVDPV